MHGPPMQEELEEAPELPATCVMQGGDGHREEVKAGVLGG